MKRCLITGGAGFIGSHLAEHLLEKGCRVHVIDNLSTGSINNILHLTDNDNFSYIVDDCQNRSLMSELVDQADEIYHLAAAVGVRLIVKDTSKTIHSNYSLTRIILEMAAREKKPVLFTSSSEVYGKSTQLPYREDGDLVFGATYKWRWSYACSKLMNEFMVLSAFRNEGIPVVILRLFNTVGPRQTGKYGMVIPNFVTQALANNPITVFGDGRQSRCFCHVHNVVPVFPLILNTKDAHGEIFNLGSNQEISILDLAVKIKKQLNSSSEIQLIPYEEAYKKGFEDMKRRIPSLEKIKDLLPFNPDIPLEIIVEDVQQEISRKNNEHSYHYI
jgi:UDP-glucose 4-epimerase